MIIVFMGPPGSGKGTQADILHDEHGFYHFDTGSRLRAEIASGSELGQRIASFTDAGRLVPIDVIKEMILKFMRETDAERIMFDGFPRNTEQAQVLDEGLTELGADLDCAIYLQIDEDSLLERIVNRRFDKDTGAIYNLLTSPPELIKELEGAGRLIQRSDDTAEVFGTRLKVYAEQTVPVLDYYRKKGVLQSIDGDRDIAEVSARIKELLGL